MVKHNEHPATEQLSAFIDKQLSMEEEAICKAHLQTCEQCQSRLAGLQQTVVLLRAMPQPELPRSFALPVGVRYLQDRPARQAAATQEAITYPPAPRRRSWSYYAQRTLRASSTIAAVIGLLFLLTSVLPFLMHPGSSTTSGTTNSAGVPSSARNLPSTSPDLTATSKADAVSHHATSPGLAPQASPKLANTPAVPTNTPQSSNKIAAPPQQPQPPIIDLNTPLGQQEVGFTLLILGIVGVLLSRRRRQRQI